MIIRLFLLTQKLPNFVKSVIAAKNIDARAEHDIGANNDSGMRGAKPGTTADEHVVSN